MRKVFLTLMAVLLLSGCATQETFETIADEPVLYEPDISELRFDLPDDAKTLTQGDEKTEGVYLCDGYSVTVEVLQTGDLAQTIQMLSGFRPELLTVCKRSGDGVETYEFVWTAVGENGNQVCRCIVLDDGVCHYAVTAMADYEQVGALSDAWNDLFSSVSLSTD